MWDKNLRLDIVLSVYNYLFWNTLSASHLAGHTFANHSSLDEIPESTNLPYLSNPENSELVYFNKQIINNLSTLTTQLSPFLNSWNKTYLIIKAILLVFLTEKQELDHQDTAYSPKTLLNKYLKLAQKYADEQCVSLIYGVGVNFI